MRGGFLHQDGEAQTVRQHSDHAAWQAADTRGAGSHARDPEQHPALPAPSGSGVPPSSPALAPSPASWLTCTHVFFYLLFCLSIF